MPTKVVPFKEAKSPIPPTGPVGGGTQFASGPGGSGPSGPFEPTGPWGIYSGPFIIQEQEMSLTYARIPFNTSLQGASMQLSDTTLSGLTTYSVVNSTELLFHGVAIQRLEYSEENYGAASQYQPQKFTLYAEEQDPYGNTYGPVGTGMRLGPQGNIVTSQKYIKRELYDPNNATHVEIKAQCAIPGWNNGYAASVSATPFCNFKMGSASAVAANWQHPEGFHYQFHDAGDALTRWKEYTTWNIQDLGGKFGVWPPGPYGQQGRSLAAGLNGMGGINSLPGSYNTAQEGSDATCLARFITWMIGLGGEIGDPAIDAVCGHGASNHGWSTELRMPNLLVTTWDPHHITVSEDSWNTPSLCNAALALPFYTPARYSFK